MTNIILNDLEFLVDQVSQQHEHFWNEKRTILGTAHLVRLAFEKKDLTSTWNFLCGRILRNAIDSAALLDLSLLLLTTGRREESMQAQKAALNINRIYRVQKGHNSEFRVLVLLAPGDLMSNTPVEFLLEDSGFSLIHYYVDENTSCIDDLPDHNIAFMAVSESQKNVPILKNLEKLLHGWTGPVLNNFPDQIINMTRDGIAKKFDQNCFVLAPQTLRLQHNAINQIARGDNCPSTSWSSSGFPIIIRPIGTHAGEGMEKIDSSSELFFFLSKHHEQEFYVCPFIDYRSSDHFYRKYRIAFIGGKAFPCHLAISEHWMVHYLNADMHKHTWRRLEEEQWFDSFDSFAKSHADAFSALHRLVPLDYFVIDCAILADGKLLLFEADVGMVVHNMDPVDVYPYKAAAMKRLFVAFQRMLTEAAASTQYLQPPKTFHTPTFLLI